MSEEYRYNYSSDEDYVYNYGSDETYSEDVFIGKVYNPILIEKPKNIQVKPSHTIFLPCKVDMLPGELEKNINPMIKP